MAKATGKRAAKKVKAKRCVPAAVSVITCVGCNTETRRRRETAETETEWQKNPEVRDDDGAPPCPIPADPAMGDKTPGVMAWYRENRPEEYRRRYGNRVCPVVDDEAVRMRKGVGCAFGDEERGPVSDFEDEEEDEVLVKPRVIMG